MRTIAVMNQKGGVGKTTTTVNLAAALAQQGRRVCIIDLDPQGHASLHVGVDAVLDVATIYDVFAGEKSLTEARRMVAANLWLVPSNIDLAAAEMELGHTVDRELILREALREAAPEQDFDYVIFDCPPSLGVLTVNALSAATEVLIPLQPHFFALQGLSKLFETTALVTQRLNRGLRVTGIVMCLYDSGTRLAMEVTNDLMSFLQQSDPEAPWANAQIFQQKIRRNIKLAEAPSFGQSVLDYEPNCAGARDYAELAKEVIQCEQRDALPAAA